MADLVKFTQVSSVDLFFPAGANQQLAKFDQLVFLRALAGNNVAFDASPILGAEFNSLMAALGIQADLTSINPAIEALMQEEGITLGDLLDGLEEQRRVYAREKYGIEG